ncbi:MAG: VWA domain-containing protein [Acidobacteriota bacterium]|nr:VWA domain-containing protein [Acidobacteriota bacterium]
MITRQGQRLIGTVAGLALLGVVVRAGGPGQRVPPAPPERPTFRAQTNEVVVDVRVRDRQGHAVTGLRRSDFRVLEDGVPQTITSFTVENVDEIATAASAGGPPPTIDLSAMPPTGDPEPLLRNHRLLVLFFDLTSMQIDDLSRALTAARRFVDTQLAPADLVAVATYTSSLRVLQDFTNDRAALDTALAGIEAGESSALSEAGSQGDATTNALGEDVVSQDTSAAFTADETEFNLFNTDEQLMAIESLAGRLRKIPGRKAILHFSSGLTQTGTENEAELRAATDAANMADVSLYTFDSRGLAALPPGGDATASIAGGTALFSGGAFRSQMSSLHDSRETLATLASDTGGRTFTDLNDFSRAFADVQRDNASYYLLGYSPTNTAMDGKFRRIRVEVDVKGVDVVSRPGYFAPKSFRQLSKADKDAQLAEALALDTPFVDLPIAVDASAFRAAGARYNVVLAAKIPGSAVPFPPGTTTRRTELDFAWRATDAAGRVVAALRDTLPVTLDAAQYQQVRHSSLVYRGGFVLPAGQYTLKVAVRENDTGEIGTFEQPLTLPAETAPLALSSVVLANELKPAAGNALREGPGGGRGFGGRGRPGGFGRFGPPGRFGPGGEPPSDPLAIGRLVMVPSVTSVFRAGQTLYVRFESYASGTGAPRDAAPPEASVIFFRRGVKVSDAGPVNGRAEAEAGRTSYFLRIPLDRFPTGRYEMQVNVLDPAAGHVAFARVPLAILPALTAAAPAGEL